MSRSVKSAAGFGLAALAASGAGSFAWGALVERNRFQLRRASVRVLPAGSRMIRVLHLSDLHQAPWQHRKAEWVKGLARLNPDLIVNTGDNLGHRDSIPVAADILGAFRGVPGVFVWGSNHYFAPQFRNPLRYFISASGVKKGAELLDTERLGDFFRDDLGWHDLNNRAAEMTINGTPLVFAGVDDPHRGFDDFTGLDAAVAHLRDLASSTSRGSAATDTSTSSDASASSGASTSSAASGSSGTSDASRTIGVAHAPYRAVLDELMDLGADLLFSGHTHGGQVCVPGYGALVTNCDIPREQVSGLSTWVHGGREVPLHISAGLGTSIYAPYRFACPPEAMLLTLLPVDAR